MKNQTTSALLLSALLAALILCASCGDGNTPGTIDVPANDTTAPVETEPVDSLAARMNVDDGLETVDYQQKTFRILGDDACEDYYIMEETTGDVLDDAIYNRNNAVTERFNIILEAAVFDENQMVTTLKNSVMAGDDEYQLFAGHVINAGGGVCDSLYYNWYDIPHIDFTKP